MLERRYTNAAETRVETRGDDVPVILGLAAVYYRADDPGTEFELFDDLRERIMPGAFSRALEEGQDVRGLFNHERSAVLGRRTAGTLRLTDTARGLAYEIDPPDTSTGRDALVSLRRGDVTGSSFGFVAKSVTWREEGDVFIRQIDDVDLIDVGPVTFPAYTSTAAGLRSVSDVSDIRRELAEYIERREGEAGLVRIRARLAELSL